MSRIILSRYDNGEERVVVGWDHPAGGAFWQEFNQEPRVVNGRQDWDNWEEVKRNGGMFPGIPLDKLIDDMPEDLRPLVTDKVMELLKGHSEDPDSGYNKGITDLSDMITANSADIRQGNADPTD